MTFDCLRSARLRLMTLDSEKSSKYIINQKTRKYPWYIYIYQQKRPEDCEYRFDLGNHATEISHTLCTVVSEGEPRIYAPGRVKRSDEVSF